MITICTDSDFENSIHYVQAEILKPLLAGPWLGLYIAPEISCESHRVALGCVPTSPSFR